MAVLINVDNTKLGLDKVTKIYQKQKLVLRHMVGKYAILL